MVVYVLLPRLEGKSRTFVLYLRVHFLREEYGPPFFVRIVVPAPPFRLPLEVFVWNDLLRNRRISEEVLIDGIGYEETDQCKSVK